MAAAVRRDPAYKAVLLSRAVNGDRWTSASAESYLTEVITPADIREIERRVRGIYHPRDVSTWDPRTSQREDLEGVLLRARLAALAAQL